MNGDLALYLIPLAVGLGGFLLGRFTAPGATRARELANELEINRKEHERACAELEAAHSSEQHYRGAVADHFVGTADRLRDLALQYRSVFDHLADGAKDLCPDRFDAIGSPLQTDLLTESSGHEEDPREEPEALRDVTPF